MSMYRDDDLEAHMADEVTSESETCIVCHLNPPTPGGFLTCQQCREALEEDERDMVRIAREWDKFDRE